MGTKRKKVLPQIRAIDAFKILLRQFLILIILFVLLGIYAYIFRWKTK